MASQYPEHERLHEIASKSQCCGEFLEWLESDGVILSREHQHSDSCYEDGDRVCGTSKGELVFDHESIQTRLARFFEIDLNKIEQEKRAMLDELRAANTKRTA